MMMGAEPTEAQIKEACDLLHYTSHPDDVPKVAHLIAQRDTERVEHEAFRQRVSEIAKMVDRGLSYLMQTADVLKHRSALQSLIQPDPTPTPEQVLAEALGVADPDNAFTHRASAEIIVNELAKRGHHVAPIKDTRHD